MARQEEILKILVVDDSDFSRKSIMEILTNHGFNVVGQASSAEEALPLAAQTEANCFLIDIVMPEVSGVELAKSITEQFTKQMYIILMSSLNTESVVIESISAGALDFLHKPFTEDQLLQSIKKIEHNILKEG